MLNFDEDFKNFISDGGSDLAAIHANRENLKTLGLNPDNNDDTVFGSRYVYCGAHRKAHSTGWCTVRLAHKRPLNSATRTEAMAEAEALGYPTTQR